MNLVFNIGSIKERVSPTTIAMKYLLRTSTVLTLGFTFAACSSPAEPIDGSSSRVADLTATTWRLESFKDTIGKILKPLSDEIYIIRFEIDGTFSGIDICNDFDGRYTASDGGNLTIDVQLVGLKLCVMGSIELRFVDVIETATAYEVQGERLLISLGAQGILTFVKEGVAEDA